MIGFIQGKLIEALPGYVLIEVGGVVFEVWTPVAAYEQLPPVGQTVRLATHLLVREEELTLYGFLSVQERDLFRLLINHVSGVGPKIALNLVGSLTPEQFREAVRSGNVAALGRIHGVGKKIAERIIVELRDKLHPVRTRAGQKELMPGAQDSKQAIEEATLALMSLGLRQNEALDAVLAAVDRCGTNASVEELIREALRQSRP